jgi:hypothetical protein
MKYTDNKASRLHELHGSDFEIADGQEDITGWDVKDAQRNKIGKVDDLVFDKESLKVRYLILQVKKDKDLGLDEKRKVLIPIGTAELDKDDDEVILPNLTINQLHLMPDYDKDTLDRDLEAKTYKTVTGTTVVETGNDFYNNDIFNDRNLYRNRAHDRMKERDYERRENVEDRIDRNDRVEDRNDRNDRRDRDDRSDRFENRSDRNDRIENRNDRNDDRNDRSDRVEDRNDRNDDRNDRSDRVEDRNDRNDRIEDRNEGTTIPVIKEDFEVSKKEEETGGIRIRKRVVETPVEEKVNLREEHVKVERKNVDRPATDRDFDNLKDQDIEIREHSEVPVVNKEARVVEEIRVKKEVSDHEETVKDSVRKTKVDIDELDSDRDERKK